MKKICVKIFNLTATWPFLLLCLSLLLVFPSCLPNGYFDRNKPSKCVLFIPKTKQILKVCNDGSFNLITSLEVEVKYDTIRIINGGAHDRFTLFESAGELSFPYNMDTIIKDKSKEMIVHLKTETRDCSYALTIQPKDWERDTLVFEFFYRRGYH